MQELKVNEKDINIAYFTEKIAAFDKALFKNKIHVTKMQHNVFATSISECFFLDFRYHM